MSAATGERHRLADTLLAVGPDAPTLCDPWRARDLAAHLVIRERRPDAALGIVAKTLAARTERIQADVARGDWPSLVERFRSGPPGWSPTRIPAVDRAVNSAEFFVHHEDLRRARPGWVPRRLEPELTGALTGALGRARLLVRSAPCGVVLAPTDGHDQVTAKRRQPSVTVGGAVGELVLWAFGRQAHAVVEYHGDPAAIESLRAARFGV